MALILMKEYDYMISLYFIATLKIQMQNTSDLNTGLQK
jgi:hypothetical protein